MLGRLALSSADLAGGSGAAGMLLVAPLEVDVRLPGLLGCAAHDGVGDPEGSSRALTDALGSALLARTVVAYTGCGVPGRHGALVREAAAVARHAARVVLVEHEADAAPMRAALAAAGLLHREHRVLLSTDGSAAARRFCLGPAPAADRMPPARVAISDHQGKSAAIADALRAAGHAVVDDPFLADAVLIDHDVPFHGKLGLVDACVAGGGRALLYPHGADPALLAGWDGLYPVSPQLSGVLVLAPGHAEVARRYGYPHPLHVMGWPYCGQRPRRTGPVSRVLFAPTHPPYLGNPRYPGRNAEMFARLRACPVHLTVRHIGTLEENGLPRVTGVEYVRGDSPGAPGMLEQIDAADCVVADRSTFGNLAVARGVTTVVWDSTLVFDNAGTRPPDHLDAYRDLLHHPFDADDGDMWDLIRAASQDAARFAAWRERFIGPPLDVDAIAAAVRAL